MYLIAVFAHLCFEKFIELHNLKKWPVACKPKTVNLHLNIIYMRDLGYPHTYVHAFGKGELLVMGPLLHVVSNPSKALLTLHTLETKHTASKPLEVGVVCMCTYMYTYMYSGIQVYW